MPLPLQGVDSVRASPYQQNTMHQASYGVTPEDTVVGVRDRAVPLPTGLFQEVKSQCPTRDPHEQY